MASEVKTKQTKKKPTKQTKKKPTKRTSKKPTKRTSKKPIKTGKKPITKCPRQYYFWIYYLSPSSRTYSNRKRSAERAGFSPTFASKVGETQWFKKGIQGNMNLRDKIDDTLQDILDLNVENPSHPAHPALLRIRQDGAQFLAQTIAGDKYAKPTNTLEQEQPTTIEHDPNIDALFYDDNNKNSSEQKAGNNRAV